MKKNTILLKVAMLSILMAYAMNSSSQTPTYSCVMQNGVMISPTVYQFDVFIYQTGSVPLYLNNYQLSFKITNAPIILNGGVLTGSYVAGSSQLNNQFAPSLLSIINSGNQSCVKIMGPAPTSCGDSIPASGLRTGTFQLTNTTNFGANPILAWNNLVPATTSVYAINPPAPCGSPLNITNMSFHSIYNSGNPPVVTFTTINEPCYGDNTGEVHLTVMGGVPPFTFQWSNGATTQDISNLAAGTYTVNITDSTGFVAAFTVTITEPFPVTLAVTSVDASCINCPDGSATVNVTGGTPPYTYLWNTIPAQTTQTCTGLVSGSYQVCVTDANGCSACSSVNISSSSTTTCDATFAVYPDSITPHHYYVVNNAVGNPPVLYIWGWGDGSPNDTAAFPSHTYSIAGFYPICLYIADATGCTDTYCNFFYIQKGTNTIINVDVIPPAFTGITEQTENNEISLYPNPAKEELRVEIQSLKSQIQNSKGGRYFIYGGFGQLISAGEIKNEETRINVSGLAKGLYLLKVVNEDRITVRRFIKE